MPSHAASQATTAPRGSCPHVPLEPSARPHRRPVTYVRGRVRQDSIVQKAARSEPFFPVVDFFRVRVCVSGVALKIGFTQPHTFFFRRSINSVDSRDVGQGTFMARGRVRRSDALDKWKDPMIVAVVIYLCEDCTCGDESPKSIQYCAPKIAGVSQRYELRTT